LSKSDAKTIATWLSIATEGDVHLAYLNPFVNESGRVDLKVDYRELMDELDRLRMKAGNPIKSVQKID
jgi:hypothetical protein